MKNSSDPKQRDLQSAYVDNTGHGSGAAPKAGAANGPGAANAPQAGAPRLTTEHGVLIEHTDDSLKAGSPGPTLIEDFHFREKMTHFDHERIPERVVHARGSGAHGTFQVYPQAAAQLAEYTSAAFLRDASVRTPVFVRFSTVAGSRGSADTARDVRGFAVRFYTDAGNFDLVGNNIPVFFIQDGIKFPDVIHAAKPEPHNEMPQAATAHDTFWDFASLMPESTHMLLWILSDRALPRSFRTMEGFGVHTFRLVNEAGVSRFVKFHWKPILGVHSLLWDEAQQISGKDPDFHRRDLWESIEAGDFPEWELGLQVIEEADADRFAFDLRDPTKLVPEELVPVQRVGRLVLNRNPENFFAETEQVAFCVSNLVPGIDVSDDPLLQARLFSYLDTQLLRLGGPNFTELPINRPVVPVHNNNQDGLMRHRILRGRVNYTPNSLGGGCPMRTPQALGGYRHYPEKIDGEKTRARPESFLDHFSQARLFYRSLTEPERRHLVKAAHFELGKVEVPAVRERVVALFSHVDDELAQRVAAGLGISEGVIQGGLGDAVRETVEAVMARLAGRRSVDQSPALSQETVPPTGKSARGRQVALLIAPGVSSADVDAVRVALQAAGAKARLVAPLFGPVRGADGQMLQPDFTLLTTASVLFDAVCVPGGAAAAAALGRNAAALRFVNEAYRHCKPLLASGEGVDVLRLAGVPEAGLAAPPDPATPVAGPAAHQPPAGDGVVRVAGAAAGEPVAAFVRALAQHRFWSRETE